MTLTVNHVACMKRLLRELTPEEYTIIDKMLVHPYQDCVFDLMNMLECEKSTVYRKRDRAIKKLLRLRYGAGADV